MKLVTTKFKTGGLHEKHCNFGDAQAESSLMMVYVNRNMSEQLL